MQYKFSIEQTYTINTINLYNKCPPLAHPKASWFTLFAIFACPHAHTQELCATWVGTVLYMSPERIESRGYSYSADVWSLGLTLMECATGAYPYGTGEGPLVLMLNVLEDPPPNLDSYDDMSDGLKVSLQCGSRHTHICEWYSYHTRDFSLIYLHTDSFRHVNVVVVHAPPPPPPFISPGETSRSFSKDV